MWYNDGMGEVLMKARCVCEAVAGGDSVLSGCRLAGVGRASFYRWCKSVPVVAQMYREACQARLDEVEIELMDVRKEIENIRASVPSVRPRGGVYLGKALKLVESPGITPAELGALRLRVSRRSFRARRQKMHARLVLPLLRLDCLRLERARLLGKLRRCESCPA